MGNLEAEGKPKQFFFFFASLSAPIKLQFQTMSVVTPVICEATDKELGCIAYQQSPQAQYRCCRQQGEIMTNVFQVCVKEIRQPVRVYDP